MKNNILSEWVRRKGAGAKVGIQVEFEIFKGPPSPHDHVVLISKFFLGSFLSFLFLSLFDCSIRLKIEHHGHTTYDLYSRTVPV
jgi:hypothetical protein